MILQLAGGQFVGFQGLWVFVFLLKWIEDEVPLHSFSTNFETKPNKIFFVYFATADDLSILMFVTKVAFSWWSVHIYQYVYM
jgi:hypothetical protein